VTLKIEAARSSETSATAGRGVVISYNWVVYQGWEKTRPQRMLVVKKGNMDIGCVGIVRMLFDSGSFSRVQPSDFFTRE
jgi:hypothetical protein